MSKTNKKNKKDKSGLIIALIIILLVGFLLCNLIRTQQKVSAVSIETGYLYYCNNYSNWNMSLTNSNGTQTILSSPNTYNSCTYLKLPVGNYSLTSYGSNKLVFSNYSIAEPSQMFVINKNISTTIEIESSANESLNTTVILNLVPNYHIVSFAIVPNVTGYYLTLYNSNYTKIINLSNKNNTFTNIPAGTYNLSLSVNKSMVFTNYVFQTFNGNKLSIKKMTNINTTLTIKYPTNSTFYVFLDYNSTVPIVNYTVNKSVYQIPAYLNYTNLLGVNNKTFSLYTLNFNQSMFNIISNNSLELNEGISNSKIVTFKVDLLCSYPCEGLNSTNVSLNYKATNYKLTNIVINNSNEYAIYFKLENLSKYTVIPQGVWNYTKWINWKIISYTVNNKTYIVSGKVIPVNSTS